MLLLLVAALHQLAVSMAWGAEAWYEKISPMVRGEMDLAIFGFE